MKKLLLVAFSLLCISFSGYADANLNEEVSCSNYGSSANTCDQCFNGGSIYENEVFKPYDVFNAGSNDRAYFDDENPIVYSFNTLNTNTTWAVSNNLLQYPDTFTWDSYQNRRVHVFKAGTNERFLETQDGKGIRLQSVANDSVSPTDPAFRFTFISNYRTVNGGLGDLEEHRECVFYQPSYCGDGVLDSGDGEVCDPNDPSRTGWGTGGCDTNTCEPVEAPTCNALTVTPVSGENPLTTTVSCEGFLVNTYEIDCGNGDVFTGNGSGIGTEQFTRECTYTDDRTYTPTCTINGNITGPSCRGNVNVVNPQPGITIDKVDQNSADLDGNIGNDTQTIESGATAVFQITVRNTGGEGLRNVSVSDENGLDCRLTEAQALTRIQAQGNRDNIFDVNESFTYMCSTSGVTADYINTAVVNGNGVISGDPVTATDPTTIVIARDFDLALVKTVVGNNTTFSRGDLITYAITVINQGDIDASGVIVTDYIPTGFTLEDSAWASEGNIASRNIGNIAAGEQTVVNIRLRVGNNVTGSVINWAEISRDGATGNNTDVDSTPDSNNNNDCHGGLGRDEVDPNSDDRTDGTGDANNNGRCDAGEDEDDHDPAVVIISDAQISIDKTDANADDLDGIIGTNDRQTVSEGERAVFKIKVTNTGTDDLNNIVLTDAIAPNCAGTVTLPSTFPNTWSNFNIEAIGTTGNPTDSVLSPGESFSYTCTRANTTENYTNIATVNADSVVTGSAVPDDSDPTQVIVELPYDLALTKSVNSDDGSDFASGEIVTFDITVINQGAVDANDVVITDYIPSALELADDSWTLSGTNATRNVGMVRAGEVKTFSINLRVRDNATSGTVINWAEISSDDGDDVDSTPDSNNNNDCHGGLGRDEVDPNSDDRTDGTGDANNNGRCDADEDEDDHDPAVITIGNPVFDLALIKEVTGAPTSFAPGDVIPFAITVVNQGSVDATNVEVTDYIPAGLELADTNWTLRGTNAVRTIANLPAGQSVTLGLSLRVKADATAGDTINWAEISSDEGDDVDSTPDSDNTNDCHGTAPSDRSGVDSDADDRLDGTGDANENGTCDAGEDEDDHDPAVVVIEIPTTNPSIAIDKVDNNSANDEDGSVGNDTQTIDRGDDAIFTITVTNDGTENLDTVVVTDSQVAACSLSEADALVLIQAIGNNDNIFNPGESFEYTCTDTSVTSSYTNSATVTAVGVDSNDPVNDTDTSPVVIDTPGGSSSSSSGGGGTSPQCGGIEINGSQVTCRGNSKAKSYKVVCGDRNNTVLTAANSVQTSSEVFDCGYNYDESSPNYNPQETVAQCFISGNNTSDANRITTTRFVCQQAPGSTTPTGSTPTCGDGVIQGGETCERAYVEIGNALVETPIATDAACEALGGTVTTVINRNNQCLLPFDDNICNPAGTANQCRVKTVIDPEPNPERPNRTVPNQGDIIFSPSTKLIIGTDRLVFDEIGADEGLNLPRILNESDYDLVFDKLCIYREGTSVNSNSTRKCKDIGTLYPYDEVFFTRDEITDYVSSTAGFGANETFRDTKLIVSLFHEGTEYKTAYFASNFDVRVTKPTIVTVGGGTTYVQDTSEVADTKDLGLFVDNANNRNFEGFSVSGDGNEALSNATDTEVTATTDSKLSEAIEKDKVETDDIKVESTAATSNKTLAQATTSYRGIDNVFIVKGNLTIDDASLLESISAPRTYVVEDGNLIINDNIASNQNIAFVVKDGDISIGSSVNSLEGTYISIGGSIGGDTTDERLVVNGSLYGDINPLVASRQYVKSDDEGNLSVGTVVNFGSSIFKKPAPLVGQFVGEYLASSKVAK